MYAYPAHFHNFSQKKKKLPIDMIFVKLKFIKSVNNITEYSFRQFLSLKRKSNKRHDSIDAKFMCQLVDNRKKSNFCGSNSLICFGNIKTERNNTIFNFVNLLFYP